MSNLPKITDFSIVSLVKLAPNIEHLELTRCETLTDYSLKQVFNELKSLKFVDLSLIPSVNPTMLEEAKEDNPNLLLKQFKIANYDKNDCGLRVPRRVREQEGKKKKKKKK